MADDRNAVACAAENRIAVAHGVHPVLMLHAAQVLNRGPVPRETYCKYGKAARIQILTEQAQLCREACKSMNEKYAVPPSRKQKRLCPLQVHSIPPFPRGNSDESPTLKNPCPAQAATGIVPILISSTSAQSQS